MATPKSKSQPKSKARAKAAKKKPKTRAERRRELQGYHPDRPKPVWNGTTLVWQNEVIAVLRQKAEEQATILWAFQKAGWPDWIPDPLGPGDPGAKHRLRNMVRKLNESIEDREIEFETDGGVRWHIRARSTLRVVV